MKLFYIIVLALCFHAQAHNDATAERVAECKVKLMLTGTAALIAGSSIISGIANLKTAHFYANKAELLHNAQIRKENEKQYLYHLNEGINKILAGTVIGLITLTCSSLINYPCD